MKNDAFVNFENEGRGSPELLLDSVPLIEKERIDSKMTFELKDERGVIYEKGDSAFWVSLQGPDGKKVEGKFFVSGNGHDKLLVFEPGMPGDSNKWMEAKFVPELLRQGYSIFCVRHRGTRVNAENSSNYVSCSERINKEKDDSGAILGQVEGQAEFSIEDIDDEPRIVIEALQKNFKQLYLVGHSSGAEGIAYSLSKLPTEITAKVHSFVSLAGYVGRYNKTSDLFDEKGIFNSERMQKYFDYCCKFFAMIDASRNVESKKRVLRSIYESRFSESINFVLVNTPKDEYVTVESSQQFRDFIGRGLRIIDETEREPDFHDLKNLQPQTLIRLLEIYHPKSKHTVTVRKDKI